MAISKKLRQSYVLADDLYEWQAENFKSFKEYKDWLTDNADETGILEEERMYRVIQKALSGLVQASASGSAAATAQLKSLTGLSRPVGRPKGTTNQSEESKLNILANELRQYDQDVERMANI